MMAMQGLFQWSKICQIDSERYDLLVNGLGV